MTTRLENDLARTLDIAAGAAPRPPAGLLPAVRRRQRQRTRNRRLTGALATGLCLLSVLAVVGLGNRTESTVPANPEPCPSISPRRLAVPIVRTLPPADEVWPCATHAVPATLPDGSPYQVAAMLGDTRYLVTSGDTVAIFDLGTRLVLKLTIPAPTPSPTSAGATAPVARLRYAPVTDTRRIVWVTYRGNVAELWVATAPNTLALLLTSAPPDQLGPPHLVGDTVLWEQGDAIVALPVTGGLPQVIPDTAGYELVTGPWAQSSDGATLLNVLTGDRRTVPKGGPGRDVSMTCTPDWCAGSGIERLAYALVPADGGPGPTVLSHHYFLVAGGRVAISPLRDGGGDPQGLVVWNPATGAAALLDTRFKLPSPPPVDLTVLNGPSVIFDLGAIAG